MYKWILGTRNVQKVQVGSLVHIRTDTQAFPRIFFLDHDLFNASIYSSSAQRIWDPVE